MSRLRIGHNLLATNAAMNLGKTSKSTAKSMEKLSSGYRINRAADDAAGLAISQKMRAQIRGLNQASNNTMDGISLIQTAEGGMGEAQSILHRIREIGVQASNDTNTPEDREALNKEVVELLKEVDRIATTTEFNKMKLLDGTLGGIVPTMKLKVLSVIPYDFPPILSGLSLELDFSTCAEDTVLNIGDESFRFTYGDDGEGVKIEESLDDTVANFVNKLDGTGRYDSVYSIKSTDNVYQIEIEAPSGTDFTFSYKDPPDNEALGIRIQAGANSGQEVVIKTGNLRTKPLGVSDISVLSFENAQNTITVADEAIRKVSTARGTMGAAQNRLEHTISRLNVAEENMTAANSRICDTDVGDEMMEYSKQSILSQSNEAVLAQANSYSEGILNILNN